MIRYKVECWNCGVFLILLRDDLVIKDDIEKERCPVCKNEVRGRFCWIRKMRPEEDGDVMICFHCGKDIKEGTHPKGDYPISRISPDNTKFPVCFKCTLFLYLTCAEPRARALN